MADSSELDLGVLISLDSSA